MYNEGKGKGKAVHKGVSGEWKYSSTHCLTSTLGGDAWSASRLGHFTPEKEPPYPLDRRLCWPRAVLDAVVKRKIPSEFVRSVNGPQGQ